MNSCGTYPTCIRSAAINAMRERTYPLIVPVYLGCPSAPWRRFIGHVFLIRWGIA